MYENVQFTYPNFCISPRSDEYCSINDAADTMQAKTSVGVLQQTYSLSSGVIEIQSLEYAGPRGLSLTYNQLGNELPFFTLEHTSSSGCLIRRWKMNNTSNTLVLQNTITLTSSGSYNFDCYDMAVEHYETTFGSSTTSGTGQISLTSVSHLEPGDLLLLGPSTDVTTLRAFEYVTVSSISGSVVYITASGITPPQYEYAATDKITYWKYAYLFSDTGQNGDATKGSLYKVHLNTGTISGVVDSGLYNGVRAAAWSRDYTAIGFVQDVNILYADPYVNYQISRSQVMTNVESDKITIIPVYDLIFNSNNIYRLQLKTTRADDSGNLSTTTWATYNYQLDSISPYTKSISLISDPHGIVMNDEQMTVRAIVRDQFGVGLSSKTLTFTDAPDDGAFDPIGGTAVTDANGRANIDYDVNYFDPLGALPDSEYISINAKTDGAVVGINGSQYVWDNMDLFLRKRFRTSLGDLIQMPTYSGGAFPAVGSDLRCDMSMTQVSGMRTQSSLTQRSKFQFPGGHWTGPTAPVDNTAILRQISNFYATGGLTQISGVLRTGTVRQVGSKTDTLEMDQLYISRHYSTGHQDTDFINQFQFVVDAIPPFYSEKNPVDTNIYIRIRPFAFSLSSSSLVFKVREVSYAGDTGYVDVTSLCTVTTFDAGGGLLGLDITYNPVVDFHYSAVIYVSLEVYDVAPTPNIILTDYWFKIIPDFKGPYIINEIPSREEEEVDVSTDISFDLYDVGVGVDISTLELYVNSRRVFPTVSGIVGGYHVSYNPLLDFYYGQTVEITVTVKDASSYQNALYDRWRFYCAGSTGPWIDRSSFVPRNCSRGVTRITNEISFNVYGVNDTGVDNTSILVTIGGKNRNITITPIIYRVD